MISLPRLASTDGWRNRAVHALVTAIHNTIITDSRTMNITSMTYCTRNGDILRYNGLSPKTVDDLRQASGPSARTVIPIER